MNSFQCQGQMLLYQVFHLIIDTVGVPKSTLVSAWVGNDVENLLLFY